MLRIASAELSRFGLICTQFAHKRRTKFGLNPDHYENNNDAASQVKPGAAANPSRKNFRSSSLPVTVNCAGPTLSPGTYYLSIRPQGAFDLIALSPKRTAGGVQGKVQCWANGRGSSGQQAHQQARRLPSTQEPVRDRSSLTSNGQLRYGRL